MVASGAFGDLCAGSGVEVAPRHRLCTSIASKNTSSKNATRVEGHSYYVPQSGATAKHVPATWTPSTQKSIRKARKMPVDERRMKSDGRCRWFSCKYPMISPDSVVSCNMLSGLEWFVIRWCKLALLTN